MSKMPEIALASSECGLAALSLWFASRLTVFYRKNFSIQEHIRPWVDLGMMGLAMWCYTCKRNDISRQSHLFLCACSVVESIRRVDSLEEIFKSLLVASSFYLASTETVAVLSWAAVCIMATTQLLRWPPGLKAYLRSLRTVCGPSYAILITGACQRESCGDISTDLFLRLPLLRSPSLLECATFSSLLASIAFRPDNKELWRILPGVSKRGFIPSETRQKHVHATLMILSYICMVAKFIALDFDNPWKVTGYVLISCSSIGLILGAAVSFLHDRTMMQSDRYEGPDEEEQQGLLLIEEDDEKEHPDEEPTPQSSTRKFWSNDDRKDSESRIENGGRGLSSIRSTFDPHQRSFGRNPCIDESSSNLPVISIPLRRDSSFCSVRSNVSYETFHTSTAIRRIRFQVVVWYIGAPDEVNGRVEMKFRVTIFWNAPADKDDEVGYGMNNPYHKRVWKMHGRQRAYETNLSEVGDNDRIIYVPPVSILNAVEFDLLGEAEVCRLNTTENLMKWSALYRASLLQDNMNVGEFPHDEHDLVLRLGILKHRQRRKRWDKRIWKLDLATREDTEDTIENPHGTIVNHVKVPGFNHGKRDLEFEFLPLQFDAERDPMALDECLQVKLRVRRESSYFDRNIIPLLACLNTVAVSTLALRAKEFGARGEMILATSFVEIGIRMTVDSRLPVVGYQIKMQFVLNNFFFGLVFLVLESSLVYLLEDGGYIHSAVLYDRMAAIAEVLHMIATLYIYYRGSGAFCDSNCFQRRVMTELSDSPKREREMSSSSLGV
ncbi:hypothetical protein IV203_012084 [Nitzschia inconspicua]|uniref:Uncharacterized protein n=1 Tax=Nitzschia inconspicua TaxID=303405 RepID=A0A9K3KTI1_9STRA|nr:hypothetical protein IV203_012084 [Nitzschia inconspicua]